MKETINEEGNIPENKINSDKQPQEETNKNKNEIEKNEDKNETIKQNNEPLEHLKVNEENEENTNDMENLKINDIKEELNKDLNIHKEVKDVITNKEEIKENINNQEAENIFPKANKENVILEAQKEKEEKVENINILEEEQNENNIKYNKESIIDDKRNKGEEPKENKINNSEEVEIKLNSINNKEEKKKDNNIIQGKEPIINVNYIEEDKNDNNIIQGKEPIIDINKIEEEPKENNTKQDKVAKNNDSLFGFFNVDNSDEFKKTNKQEDSDENKKNSAELNKLREVFLNSFTLQSKSEKGGSDNNKPYKKETNDPKNKQKTEIFQQIIKFKNELNLKKKLKKFNLFHTECKSSEEKVIYKLGKVLVYTYRKNFPKIKNYKNKKTFITDAWWGCMVRCGQMILSRGIYHLLKKKGLNTEEALYYTVPLFANYPIKTENLHPFFLGMLDKYREMTNLKESPDKEIKEFYAPFSIKTLCDIGEIYERTAGEWFSDVIITGIFRRISEYYNLFTQKDLNVKIMTFQSCIEMKDVLAACFEQKKYDKNNQEHIHYLKKYYYFKKMGIIFINVRVGLDKIPKEYYPGIKKLFDLKECIGIIGGKTRLAYYFIGYNKDDDSLLYLDPHVTLEADKEINMQNILSKHVSKEIHLLKMSKMSTAFTIGFCFRNYNEFLHMYEFWIKAKNDKMPILGIVKQNIEYDGKNNFDEEDCSPTYEDKDEDDF